MTLEIDEVSAGEYIGAYEIVKGLVMQGTYLTILPCEILQMTYYDLTNVADQKFLY